ncbi:MAG: extracellular solute-binding protein [Lachnospiraceae bacterium]|nr:extracellular solute-binding protein [Lachnospiraceae bacterium]
MKKKVLATLLAATLVIASLAGCGKKENNGGGATGASTQTGTSTETTQNGGGEDLNFNITVWVPELAVELTKTQIAAFNSSNTDGITFNATVEAVSEADSATTMITDVESGADIYFFAQDQAARLIQSGALSKLGVKAAETVAAENTPGVVSACMSGEDMYAYPLTADNGYFMYYDKSVVSDDHVDSLTDIIADCEAAGKTFCMEMGTSAWYLASFFFGTGCVSEWETDNDGNFVGVNDTFNSDKGLIAAKGMYQLVSSPAFVSSSQATQFDEAIPAGVVVSGTWDYNTAESILGENMGAADLPEFVVDGKSYHMGSYNGCKLLGVKPQSDAARSASIHKLAQYLTNESAQLERFDALAWGPANLNAQSSNAVLANPGLVALNAQAPYSVPQGQIHGSWWDIAKVIGTDVQESDGSDEQLKAALQKYQDTIAALFNMTSDEKEAFSAIGTIDGTNWDTDIPMTRSAEVTPTYYSDAILLHAGEEFKVRQGASWDVNFGVDGARDGDNFKVEEDGYYFIKLVVNDDLSEGIITLEKNSYVNGWTIIGTINGTNWDTDFEMEIQDDGTTFVGEVEAEAGSEFKVRQGHNWDVSYGNGADNYVVENAGTIKITFDSTTGTVTVE